MHVFHKSTPQPPAAARPLPQPMGPSPMIGQLRGVVGASDPSHKPTPQPPAAARPLPQPMGPSPMIGQLRGVVGASDR